MTENRHFALLFINLLPNILGVAYSSCPGCFTEVEISTVPEIEEIKNIASATSTKLIAGNSDGNCRVNLASLINFQSQVGVFSIKIRFKILQILVNDRSLQSHHMILS